jgi:hypothetical protein
MKRRIVNAILAGSMIVGSLTLGGCASCSRDFKTIGSNLNGGMNRVVKVYDYNGNLIQQWEGKIDLDNSDQETYFDLDGKRVIIQGGIVITEEV